MKIFNKFATPTLNDKGELTNIEFHYPENFNFSYDVVDVLAAEKPNKLAMLWLSKDKDIEKRFTFADIAKYTNKTANFFLSQGIKKGDKVILVLKRHFEFWFSILALHKIGAIAIPATHLLVEDDFVYRFNSGDISAIVCTADGNVADEADKAMKQCPQVKTKIIAHGSKEGWINFTDEVEKASDLLERIETKATDLSFMFFTSGTTAYPKIAMHNFTYPLGHIVTAEYWQNVDENGIHWTISDTGWAKALWGKIYGQWLSEAAIFTYDFDKFDSADILPLFSKYQLTTFCAPPTMFRFFIKNGLENYDLSSLKYVCIAGEALAPEVFYQFKKATGLSMMEGFGQTETTCIIANLRGTTPTPGSMGIPQPQYKVRLVNNEGKNVEPDEIGEICVVAEKGEIPGMFLGYYNNDEKTDKVWSNGLYHTGDTAKMDENGYFWYIGRTDDMIKSSGYRIGPVEVENVIMEIPYVLECAVTGEPDEIRGQIIKATIVLVDGKEITDTLAREVQDYVKSHTAPYKYPRIIEFVTELPKTISGKIRRVAIRAEA